MSTHLYLGPPMDWPPTAANLHRMAAVPGVASIHGYIDDHKAQQLRFLEHFQRPTRR